MASTARATRQARKAREAATAGFKVSKFALLSEMLLVGVGLFVLGIPIVTAPAAYAAGAAHMERHVSGRSDTVASLWADFRAALPGSWKFGLWVLLGSTVAAVNLTLAASEQLPGGQLVLTITVVLAVLLAVLLLRTAALWPQVQAAAPQGTAADQSRSAWASAWRQAKHDIGADWVGTLLIVVALGLCLAFVWMLLPLLFIVPGALTLAVVSVRFRQLGR